MTITALKKLSALGLINKLTAQFLDQMLTEYFPTIVGFDRKLGFWADGDNFICCILPKHGHFALSGKDLKLYILHRLGQMTKLERTMAIKQ